MHQVCRVILSKLALPSVDYMQYTDELSIRYIVRLLEAVTRNCSVNPARHKESNLYNLLVSASGWAEGRDTLPSSRVVKYTEATLRQRFMPDGTLDTEAVMALPTLFMEESHPNGDPVAQFGKITRIRHSGRELRLDYTFDPLIPPLLNSAIEAFADDLDIEDFEFMHTHWAIKEEDLFEVLLKRRQPRRQTPRVFQLADPEVIEQTLVSAMMPFHPDFNDVYGSIESAAQANDLLCRRADNIWESPLVMQDVVSLIDRSKIIVCDCSGRNPNVFYEIGIAHTLGREVILITQSEVDIPFDLRHLRHLQYHNNEQGRGELQQSLAQRFSDII